MRDDWVNASIGDIAHVQQGRTLAVVEMRGGRHPVFGANGVIGWHDQGHYEHPVVALGCRGSCGTIHIAPKGSWLANNVMAVWPKDPGLVSTAFLALVLEAADLVTNGVVSGQVQPQITRASLLPLTVPLPPLSEQRRIVDLIGTIDEAVAAAEAVLRKGADMRAALIAGFFSSTTEPEVPLGTVAEVAQGSSLPVSLQGQQTGPVPWYKVKDMASLGNDWGYRRAETMLDAATISGHGGRVWPVGAVVFPRVGAAVLTNKKRLLKVAGACDENHLVVVPRDGLLPGYLLAALENVSLTSLVRSEAYPSLNQSIVRSIPIVVPVETAQQRLAGVAEGLRAVEEAAHANAACASRLRETLLSVLLSGRHHLPESYDRLLDDAA